MNVDRQALHYAAYNGNHDIVIILIDNCVNINSNLSFV